MRVDLFLKLMGLVKTRMAAKRLCEAGKVTVDSKPAEPSTDLPVGAQVAVELPFKRVRGQVLGLPGSRSVSKKERSSYFQVDSIEEY